MLVLVSRSYVTRLFEVDTDFKNIFTLKKLQLHSIYITKEGRELSWSVQYKKTTFVFKNFIVNIDSIFLRTLV